MRSLAATSNTLAHPVPVVPGIAQPAEQLSVRVQLGLWLNLPAELLDATSRYELCGHHAT